MPYQNCRDQLAPRYASEIMGSQRLGMDLFRPILYSGEGGFPQSSSTSPAQTSSPRRRRSAGAA